MDSLFDSIIPLLIVLFYLFGSFFRKKTKEGREPTQTEPAYPQPEVESDDLRDEIRRRFEERAGVFQPELVVEEPPPPVPVHPSVEEALLAQRERHKKIKAEVANVKKGKGAYARTDSVHRGTQTHSLSRSVRTRLNSPLATREAIVLMEVLGTPVGIKQMEEEARALANS